MVRIDEAVGRLQSMVDLPEIKTEPVDVAHLLETLLDEQRDEIQARRLLVLKELDHSVPPALSDPLLLRAAFRRPITPALRRLRRGRRLPNRFRDPIARSWSPVSASSG